MNRPDTACCEGPPGRNASLSASVVDTEGLDNTKVSSGCLDTPRRGPRTGKQRRQWSASECQTLVFAHAHTGNRW